MEKKETRCFWLKENNTDVLAFTLEDSPQVYRVIFDVNKLCEAENQTGLNLFVAFSGLAGLTFNVMRGLLFGLLTTAHEVKIAEVGALLTKAWEQGNQETIYDAITTCVHRARAIDEDKKTEE